MEKANYTRLCMTAIDGEMTMEPILEGRTDKLLAMTATAIGYLE